MTGTVLILETDKDVRRDLHNVLSEHGIRVLEAATITEAWAQFEAHPVNMLVFNHDYAYIHEFLAELEQINKLVPFVVILEKPDAAVVRHALQQGAVDCINKEEDNFIDEVAQAVLRVAAPAYKRWMLAWIPLIAAIILSWVTGVLWHETAELRARHARQREVFCEVLASSTQAVIILDQQGKIVVWSDGAEELFGYKYEDVVGLYPDFIMGVEYRDRHRLAMQYRGNVEDPVKVSVVECDAIHKDGHRIPVLIHASYIPNHCGTLKLALISPRSRVDRFEAPEK